MAVGENRPYTQLSHNQVLQQSFDESQDRLRVEASLSSGGDVGTTDGGLDVYVVNQSLSGGVKSSRYTATAVAQKLVADVDKLTDAKVIGFRILGDEPVYIGNSSVTALSGYPKYSNEEMVLDVKGFDIYIICDTGKTCSYATIQLA